MSKALIPSGPPPLTGLRFIAAALFLIIVWGTAFTMIEVAILYLPPIWVVALRTLFGALVVIAYALYRGRRFPKLTDSRWLWFGFLGFIGMVLPFFLVATAQESIDSGISAILVGIMPLATLGLAHIFTTEKMNRRKVIGFVIGFIGTIILFLPDNFSLGLISDWRAQLLCVGGAICYAVTTVAAKRAPETPPSVAAAMMVGSAAVFGMAWACFTGVPSFNVPPIAWVMIAGLAIGSTGLATIVYLLVINRNGPTTLAKINYFPPFASVIAGVWLLGEPFTLKIGIAFTTIMLGVWIAREKKPFIPH